MQLHQTRCASMNQHQNQGNSIDLPPCDILRQLKRSIVSQITCLIPGREGLIQSQGGACRLVHESRMIRMIGLIILVAQIIILMTRMMTQICKNSRRSLENKARPLAAPRRGCLLYTSPSPRDKRQSRMPSSA